MRVLFLVLSIMFLSVTGCSDSNNAEAESTKLTQTLTSGGIPSDKAMSTISKELLDATSSGKVVARADTPESKLGKEKFTYWCATCHAAGLFERGLLPGTASLAIKYKGEKPAALEHREDLQGEYIKYVIRNGSEGMPFFRKTEVSDTDMAAIAVYLSPDEIVAEAIESADNTVGAALYSTHCVACHNTDLSGGIGASLLAEEYIHGSTPKEMAASIANGYGDKGMPTFSATLSSLEIQSLIDYIVEQRKKKK